MIIPDPDEATRRELVDYAKVVAVQMQRQSIDLLARAVNASQYGAIIASIFTLPVPRGAARSESSTPNALAL